MRLRMSEGPELGGVLIVGKSAAGRQPANTCLCAEMGSFEQSQQLPKKHKLKTFRRFGELK